MARYDRIAPLPAPDRTHAFPAWLTLRDLEGRERDPELGRRARLRFLALRPVRRLLEHGIDKVPVDSYERQIEGVREELGHLSARDPERTKLSQFLHRIRERTPASLVTATLDMGGVAEAAGHYFAATEYYITALELSERYGLTIEQVNALRVLGRISRKSARWTDADTYYGRAIDLASRLGDHHQWARAMDGLGHTLACQGNYPKARNCFEEVLARGQELQDDIIVATACSSLCLNALTAGDPERALEFGWMAIGRIRDEEERMPVLGNLGLAFTQLGLYTAAERCYDIIASRSLELVTRGKARIEFAAVAAEAGDAATFRSRRTRLLSKAGTWNDEPWLTAQLHLYLGRGCLLIGDTDDGRDHLRKAIQRAEAHGYNECLIRAEELLTALEEAVEGAPSLKPDTERPGQVAKRIAAEVESYGAAPAGAAAR